MMAAVFFWPALPLIAGGFAVLLLPQKWRSGFLLALPLAGAAILWSLPDTASAPTSFAGYQFTLLRLDALSRIFAAVFLLGAFLAALYAWHVRDPLQQAAGSLYAGFAVAAVCAGDLLSFFVFWEGTALTSVLLIWARRTRANYYTGLRYLAFQLASGLSLLAGLSLYAQSQNTLAFDALDPAAGAGFWLILLGFGIKAAFPLFHRWLSDAYPASTVGGAVYLSIFTTKLAIYALARGFPAAEILIYIGIAMALLPVFYAVIEDDLRRVLAYGLNSQLGFMVTGIGIGTPLALNGVAAHAFCHVLYEGLLFMSMGALMFRAGTARASDAAQFYKSMPLTAVFCLAGAAGISSLPLFAGFVSKSLILSAAAEEGWTLAWFALTAAWAGAVIFAGARLPYMAFFAGSTTRQVEEAPRAMLLAMGLAAGLVLLIGVWPQMLYAFLPYDVSHWPYDYSHIMESLQLIVFALLAYAALLARGLWPAPEAGITLDVDWFYRRSFTGRLPWHYLHKRIAGLQNLLARIPLPEHGSWTAGAMAIWTAVLLAFVMLFVYA